MHPSAFHVDSLMVAASGNDFGKAIVDSGTTLSYFPSAMFSRLMTNVDSYCGTHESCHAEKDQSNNKCWRLNDPKATPAGFPTLHLKFDQNREDIAWEPTSYLSRRGYGVWCYAIAESQNGDTILGISWMLHRDTVFDLATRRIGMASADCPNYKQVPTSLWERLAGSIGSLGVRPAMQGMIFGAVLAAVALASLRFSRAFRESTPGESHLCSARHLETIPSDMHALLKC